MATKKTRPVSNNSSTRVFDALINKIKDEVKIAINDQLNNLNHISNVDNEHIISQLNKEINYLKQELLSKNNIIELILNERQSANNNNQVN